MKMVANYVVFKNPLYDNGTVDYVAGPFNFYSEAMDAINQAKDDYHVDNHKLLVVVSVSNEAIEI
jgi:hypothetical protein